jgi:mRNA interferase MazF
MTNKNKNNIRRGDIYIADLDPSRGAETSKERRVLIISNDAANSNPFNKVVIAVPILGEVTPKRLKMPMLVPIYPTASNGQTKPAMIDCFQIRILSIPDRIGSYKGTVDASIMKKVDRALEHCLSLKNCPQCQHVLLPNRNHCVNCKHVLVAVCKSCSAIIDSSYHFCPACGHERGE